MHTVGVICEFNPLHLGHLNLFKQIRAHYGEDSRIVCVMSGNYVQRGSPAIFDKSIRALAAIQSGADLVLELPLEGCLSSAEGFAFQGIQILGSICNAVAFGTETVPVHDLFRLADLESSEAFPAQLRKSLESGCSFPAARNSALRALGWTAQMPELPNDILAFEYCRAIRKYNLALDVFTVKRENNYHSESVNVFPSATAVRKMILAGEDIAPYVSNNSAILFNDASIHDIHIGEKAILYRLKTMSEHEYEMLPFGAEGLWRRFMHACRSTNTVDEILQTAKTKRYAYTRLSRMLMCAFLGITQERFSQQPPYIRILGFSNEGRRILHDATSPIPLVNAGSNTNASYQEFEYRCGELYDLFTHNSQGINLEKKRSVVYVQA